MQTIIKDILTALFMGAVVPGILLNAAAMMPVDQAVVELTVPETTEGRKTCPMRLRDEAGEIRILNMDEYLVGVVLAEMPASFEEEALKAQAVAARTYTRKAYDQGGKHGDGSVCVSSACCQAYIAPEDYLARGGTREDLDKVQSAVETTSGQVLTYEGALIESTYFSCSGGVTEDAAAVWGRDFPYLRSVESPGEEQAAHYRDTAAFSSESLSAALGEPLSGAPDTWFGEVTYTEGGGVASMTICGKPYTGTQLRRLLGLRSTAFTVEAGEEITFTTRGYGHRVGMSQYGADAMAATGSTYEKILAHYYPGTQITRIPQGK